MRWKAWLTMAVAAVLVLGAAACGEATEPEATDATEAPAVEEATGEAAAPDEEPVSVTVWYHSGREEERDALQQTFEAFAEAYPNIEIDATEIPEGSYNDQVQAAAFADDLPCLLDFDGPNLYNYVWGGFLIPLDPYVTEGMRADFLPSILEQGTFQDGKLYSLGQFDSGLALFANGSYLEAADVRVPTIDAPWTRQEFDDALAALQALPTVEYALDLKMNYGRGEWYTYGFSPVLQGFGADLIDRSDYQSADGVLDSPQAVEAMTMIQGWFEDGYANPDPAGDTEFIDGVSAISWVGHWAAPGYQEELGDDLLLLPMPDFGNGPKTGMGSWNWGITSRCPVPDEAWQVLEFLVEPEWILVMTDANGAVPARTSAFQASDQYGEGGALNLYIMQLQAGFTVPRPITPAYPAITTAFQEAFDNIKDGADVQTELDKAVAAIDKDIADNDGYQLE